MDSIACRTAKLLLVASVLLPCLAAAQSAPELVSRIQQLNARIKSLQHRSLSQRADLPNTQDETAARTRLTLLKQLARRDPAAARSVMFSAAQSSALIDANPALAGLIESPSQWTGSIEQTIEDDFANRRSLTHWFLHIADGQRLELLFDRAPDRGSLLNRTVTVAGMSIDSLLSVSALSLAAPSPDASTPACTTIGAQNTAVLIMNQKTSPVFPSGLDQSSYWSPQYFNSSPKSVNSFWNDNSFGVTSNGGSIYGPFTLDNNYSCDQTDPMATAAITIAKNNGVDFSQFTRVSIIFPANSNSCGFGGLGTIGCRQSDSLITHPYSVTWIPALEYYTTNTVLWGLLAHEQGHNLGLGHSNSLDFGTIPLGAIDYTDSSVASTTTAINTEYGDPYTIMGGGSYTCGGHYTAFNKNQYLAWLGSSSVTEVTSSGTFTLVPFENNSGVRGVRVLRDALTGSWLWLEYRQALGSFDSAFTSCESGSNILQGALGYYESPNSSDGRLYLIDFNPSSAPNNFNNSALVPGHTWSDPYSLLTLTVNSADANGLSVTTSYDQPCATLTLSTPVISATGGSGSVSVTAPGTCSWQASTAANWITFTGVTSGTGNGTVPFTVANNTAHDQRNSYITIQRQSLPIAQKGTGTFISNLSPALQFGSTSTINFIFEDPLGTNDIDNLDIYFQDYASCWVYMDQTANHSIFFFIYDNDSGAFTTSITPGQNATISNAHCSLSGVGTSVTRVGNQLQLALKMTFTSAFLGSHRVSADVKDATATANPLPEISLGTFQATLPPSISSVTPNSGKQGFSVPIVITGLNTHFTNSSTVTISGTGVTSSAISASSSAQLNATLTITGAATLGARTLTVTSATEVVTSTFTVNGTGKVSLSPASLTFALQTVGTTSASQPITLTNSGNAVLNISSITATGEFGVTHNCGASLNAAAQCTLNITFQPLNYGTRTGSVTITDDGPGSPHNAALTGTAQLSFTPTRPPRTTRPAAPTIPVLITSDTATVPVEIVTVTATAPAPTIAVKPAPTVTCAAPRTLGCSVEKATAHTFDSSNKVSLDLHVDTERAVPGTYVVVLTLIDKEDENRKEEVKIPIKVMKKSAQKDEE
jgi:M6 family metalloprotease-like protein